MFGQKEVIEILSKIWAPEWNNKSVLTSLLNQIGYLQVPDEGSFFYQIKVGRQYLVYVGGELTSDLF